MLLHQQARPCAAHTGRWLFLLMAAVVLAGCAGPSYPPAPLKAAGGDYQYIIGPLDTLAISVWRNPELATTVTVRGSEGGKQYSLRLRDLIRNGDVSANAEVRPGDVIIIPQGWL
jgi:protein involved in polysaccharide export with SLBB domain